jgi:NADPH2:quinone reductase
VVRELTAGVGVVFVFDSVGRDTFDDSLEILALRGHLVLFGAASGAVAAVDPLRLMRKSLTLTRPVMPHYLSGATVLRQRAEALFTAIDAGYLQLRIHCCSHLKDAAIAHQALAARSTQGKLLLAINADL